MYTCIYTIQETKKALCQASSVAPKLTQEVLKYPVLCSILPWSVEFDEGEALSYGFVKVALCENQHVGLQKQKAGMPLLTSSFYRKLIMTTEYYRSWQSVQSYKILWKVWWTVEENKKVNSSIKNKTGRIDQERTEKPAKRTKLGIGKP